MGWGGAGSQAHGAAGGYQPTAAQGYASYGQQPGAASQTQTQTQTQAAGTYGQSAQGCVPKALWGWWRVARQLAAGRFDWL
jgi:hypothetical protein